MNFIINSILENKIARTLIIVLALMLVLGGTFAYLMHRAREAEKTAAEAQTNANRAIDKATGLEIIINSNTQAAEIEREKEKANAQAVNSNTAVNAVNDSVRRDSNTFAGNTSESRKRFCKNFPDDSKCR